MSHTAPDDDIVAELLPAFIGEAHEQVTEFEHLMLQLESQPGEHALLDALFRCAHTIKGSAGVFGLNHVVEFTHHVEGILDDLREGRLALTPALGTLLLQSNDAIRALVDASPGPGDDSAREVRRGLVDQLQAASSDASAATPAACPQPAPDEATIRRWQVAISFGVDTFRNGLDPLSVLSYLEGLGRIEALVCDAQAVPGLEDLDAETCHLAFEFDLLTDAPRERIEHAFDFVREDSTLSLEEASPLANDLLEQGFASADAARPSSAARGAAREPAAAVATGTGEEGGYIRVHANRLDEVINLLGELVIAGAGAAQLAGQTRNRSLIEANRQITRLIEGIRNSTLKLRMVPIGETFSRFRRVVRDTASSLGKDVALDIVGGDTELDKALVERIADPLMHLVRNALDHGLELPEERLAAGKTAQGRLTLDACHESGSILIRIIDNGRGIQRDKVLQRAWQRGLVEQGVVPDDAEILRLIFEPGFSTAEKVTNLSGRGVGMDVVRSNIEALRGSVAIESVEGQGSTIEIRLPLTLAIIDGFLVGVGSSRFIFPLDAVVEVIACPWKGLTLDAHGRGCVELRGRHLPVTDLRTLYALDGERPANGSVVVVRIGTRRYGVVVDQLLGQHQTVIKPLGRLLRSLRGISGSSILGSGEVALIFDIDALGRLASGPASPASPSSTLRRQDASSDSGAPLALEGKRP